MTQYIDGFVLPVPRDRLDEYRSLVEAVAQIWHDHGAIDYREFVGDDLILDGTQSFVDLIDAAADEAIIFGWVAFESKAARDVANEKVAADPRMADLVNAFDSGFDAKRMAYAGFEPLVPAPGNESP